ncbi:hypothetical protein, partial [Pontibacillus yanchengensis]
ATSSSSAQRLANFLHLLTISQHRIAVALRVSFISYGAVQFVRRYPGACAFVLACQNSENTLDVENLEVENSNNKEPKRYNAKSLEIAISSLPFSLNVPTEMPSSYHPFKPVLITDWNDIEDGRDIAIQLKSTSKETDNILSFYARDYDMSILQSFKKDAEKISLENNVDVYFNAPDKYSEWHTGHISWVDSNIFYSVELTGSDLKASDVRRILLDLVKQTQ